MSDIVIDYSKPVGPVKALHGVNNSPATYNQPIDSFREAGIPYVRLHDTYRNWWQMIPNLAGSNDNFKSWPSGNMTIAAMMFSLPLLTDVLEKRSMRKNWIAYGLACGFVLLYGYNRIHMTNHFLSDVCFGTLITYLIFSAVSCAFLRTADHENSKG